MSSSETSETNLVYLIVVLCLFSILAFFIFKLYNKLKIISDKIDNLQEEEIKELPLKETEPGTSKKLEEIEPLDNKVEM
tara:strand:- start:2638 stop:2874 length:237 start_codon:yes stop_codon:yes gene_type:complete